MTKRITYLTAIFLIALAGCRGRKSESSGMQEAIPVVASRAAMIPIPDEISLSGNIEGYKTVRLGFMVAGKIDYISVNEGDKVTQGQVIASLDPASYSIAKEIADIQVSQVQDEYNRLKAMHDSNSLSESDFSKISYGLQLAKAQQKLHAKNLQDTKLYSPLDGILLKKLAETGEIIGTGLPLFVVSDIRKIKVSAFIPENELHKIRIGQKAEVHVSSLESAFEGKITEVGSAADAASRSFSVKIELPNPDLLIRPGMIAEVQIIPEKVNMVLSVPAGAVLHDFNDKSYVYVIDAINNKAYRRDIIPGKIIQNDIEIISGLSEGETIATGGQYKLTDGSVVEISK